MAKTETKKKEVSEPKLDGSQYSCQVILEKCTLEQLMTGHYQLMQDSFVIR